MKVQYYRQTDNTEGQAGRTCFSSCCAMVLNYYRPNVLTGPNGDDQYRKRLETFGDTTDPNAQAKCLKYFGIDAHFSHTLDFADLIRMLKDLQLTPTGMLIRGTANDPTGGGHYVLPLAVGETHLTVHDPYGEQDLVNGGFVPGKSGESVSYSRVNFGKRWMPEGPKSGWGMIIRRPRG